MNFKKSLGIFLFVLFTSQIFLVVSSGNMKYTNFSARQTETSTPYEEISFVSEAAPGFENVMSNVIRDSGFEETGSDGGPKYFYYGGDGYEISNASYQDDVQSGSYSMYVSAEGTIQFSTTTYSGRSLTNVLPYVYLDQDLSLDMWFKVKGNPDFDSNTYANMYIQFYDSGQPYYLYYYFSYKGTLPANSTTYGYYDVRQPVGSWFHLQRNLTEDFEAALPSVTINPTNYASYMQFRCYSKIDPTGPTEMIFDEISIANGTGYDILSNNGDFEVGTGTMWQNFNRGPATIEITDEDYTEGSHCLNMTSHVLADGSDSSFYCQKDISVSYDYYRDSFYPTEPGEVVIDHDWKYSETENGGTSQQAMNFIYLQNETTSAYIYFLLGEDSDTIPYGNYTGASYLYRYYAAPSFGSRDTWEHFHLDLYDLYQAENFGNLIPYGIGFLGNAGSNKNSTVTLLVDDISIIADPLGDPSFELDTKYQTTDPLYSWASSNHNYVNRTTSAHSGNYAANVTAYSSSFDVICYRNAYLPVEENLYTDFWWRLDDLSGPASASSYIFIEFDNSYYLFYILGFTGLSYTNTSNFNYIHVENQNQTGTWFNLFRNVNTDASEAFGVANLNITEITLGCYSSGSSRASTIFDDIYFVRDVAGPDITSLAQTPLEPQYGEAVTVEVDVTDNVDVFAVEMYYRVGAGSWVGVPMTNTGGSHYEAGIPTNDYNAVIQYYIAAYDIYGYETLLGSDMTPFEYTVADLIDPILNIEAPSTSDPILGSVIFNMTGEDPGSGIASFEITIDSETVLTDTIIPTEYIWDTTGYENGNCMITFALTDNAGNIALVELEYIIENPTTPTGGIGFVILSLIALSGLLSFVILRRRK